MKTVRIVLEFKDLKTSGRVMRWERVASDGSAFELLGRAFEAAQREEPSSVGESLQAFLRGAMLQKQDVIDALGNIQD